MLEYGLVKAKTEIEFLQTMANVINQGFMPLGGLTIMSMMDPATKLTFNMMVQAVVRDIRQAPAQQTVTVQ
jgi:hypothetical protein